MSTEAKGLGLVGVNHVVVPVANLARSVAFYRDYLGIKEVPKMVPNENLVWLRLPSKVMVHLIEGKSVPAPDPVHIAFEVEDLDAAVKLLEEKKIAILSSGTRKDGQRYVFFRDPDGNRVELCTPSGF